MGHRRRQRQPAQPTSGRVELLRRHTDHTVQTL